MAFSTAPLLSAMRIKGGTFYSFSPSVKDNAIILAGDTRRFEFSKFACLKLPKWANVVDQSMFYDGNLLTPATTDQNLIFPKAVLQNYIENMLQYSEGSRIDSSFSNFAEAAFWKALRSEKFNSPMRLSGTTAQVFDNNAGANVTVYTEEGASGTYDPILKYVGDINMLNEVRSGGNKYVEVYAHVPTSAGYMTGVRLRPNTAVQHDSGFIPSAGGNQNAVVGLDDYDGAAQVDPIYDTVDFKYDASSDADQIGIDWEDYPNLVEDTARTNQGDFEFNAVLVYYDIVDDTDESTLQRNLYGILLLEDFETSSVGFEIPSLKKYQPNADTAGNSFGFRFNLKFSNSTDQITSEVTVNDYNTISMELYMEALTRLQIVQDQYNSQAQILADIVQRNNDLNQSLLSRQEELLAAANLVNGLELRIQSLEANAANTGQIRITNEDLLRLFVANSEAAGNSNIQIIMTAKALFPTLIDQTNLIFEDANGVQYQLVNGIWVEII